MKTFCFFRRLWRLHEKHSSVRTLLQTTTLIIQWHFLWMMTSLMEFITTKWGENSWPSFCVWLHPVFTAVTRWSPNLLQHVSDGLQLSFTLGFLLLVFWPMNLAKIGLARSRSERRKTFTLKLRSSYLSCLVSCWSVQFFLPFPFGFSAYFLWFPRPLSLSWLQRPLAVLGHASTQLRIIQTNSTQQPAKASQSLLVRPAPQVH